MGLTTRRSDRRSVERQGAVGTGSRDQGAPADDPTDAAPPRAQWMVVASGRPIHNMALDCHGAGSTTIHPNQGYAT
jgi:hypothetical protein